MSAVSYENLFPYVQPHVPSCPDPSLVLAIKNACIEFCTATNYLNADLDLTQVDSSTNTYEIDVPTGYQLSQILELYVDGLPLRQKSPLELVELYGVIDWQTMEGQPRFFTQFNTSEVVIAPRPTTSLPMTGRYSYTPTQTSTTVDSTLFADFPEAIAKGALARVYMHPNQPYTSPSMALAAGREFRSEIANASAFVKGGMRASTPMRVRFNRFW